MTSTPNPQPESTAPAAEPKTTDKTPAPAPRPRSNTPTPQTHPTPEPVEDGDIDHAGDEGREWTFKNSHGDTITTRVPAEAVNLRAAAGFTEITDGESTAHTTEQ